MYGFGDELGSQIFVLVVMSVFVVDLFVDGLMFGINYEVVVFEYNIVVMCYVEMLVFLSFFIFCDVIS